MQTEVPGLPVVCSDGRKRYARNPDINAKSSSVEVKNNPTSKNSSFLVSNRKQLHPLVGGPYRDSMRLYALSEPPRSTNKNSVVQRVTSAKMLRVKQLQNQLTDAHYHLNELANENRLLKALQKRQDSALKRYEGTNAELPRIINSHHEELKVLQTKHKKLRTQHKHTCDLLKEKENEIHSLQAQNKHLIQLSKDRHLEVREKLQMRVSDLNFRIEQQQETIQTLNRKLALESKSLKHQLNAEVAKHRETQKHLNEALDKLKSLEDMLDNRERRLLCSGRLPVCNKLKSVGGQSFGNLGNNGAISNPLKSGGKNRGSLNDLEIGSLPKLALADSNDGKSIPHLRIDHDAAGVTETMSSLQQVRKFRLQKSYSRNGSAGRPSDLEKREEDDTERIASSGVRRPVFFDKLKSKPSTTNENDSADEEVKKLVEDFETTNGKEIYKLPKQLMREFGYSSSESESEEDTKIYEALEYESTLLTNKSRDLHDRLIGDETAIGDSIVAKFCKKKSSKTSTTTESDTDAETERLKNLSFTKKNRESDSRRESLNFDVASSNPTTKDLTKLDTNATGTNAKMERRDKSNVDKTDGSSNVSTLEAYENSQQRLTSITQSWTKLQEKIKRDREISESQLKTLNDEIETDGRLSAKKLIDVGDNENSKEKQKLLDTNKYDDDAFEDSSSRSKKISDEEPDENFETNRISEKVAIEDSTINDNRPIAMEMAGGDGHRSITVESHPNNEDDLIDEIYNSMNREKTKKSTEDDTSTTKRAIEENGLENGEHNENDNNDKTDIKIVNYNKQKLLAAMRAIDDNDNIDFSTSQKNRIGNLPMRSQTTITENLYRGLPTHARKDEILKELFGDGKTETKIRAGCSKLH